jgi:hypothetical protein
MWPKSFGKREVASLVLFVAFLLLSSASYAIVQVEGVADVSPDFPFGANPLDGNLDGRIHALVIDPSNDSTLYAASPYAGVWKSTDGAKNWTQASHGLRNGLSSETAYPQLAIDNLNPQRLLFASESKDGRPGSPCEGCQFGGLWITTDGASNWQHIVPCSNEPMPSSDNVGSVAFSTGRPFVVTDCGLWTTNTSSLVGSWIKLPPPPDSSWQGAIVAGSDGGNALFACLHGGTKVYRSSDLGQTWDSGVDIGGTCWGVAAEPGEPSRPRNTSLAISLRANGVLEVSVIDSSSHSKQDLGFLKGITGSGRPGIWVTPARVAMQPGAGRSYDVFAADRIAFYRYSLPQGWSSTRFPLHDDTWWMAFPSRYDPSTHSCPVYAVDDAGIQFASGDCGLEAPAVWGGASHGLHATWSIQISGYLNQPESYHCPGYLDGQKCPILFVGSVDTDTFTRTFVDQPIKYDWVNFPDGLGDSGAVLIDLPSHLLRSRTATPSTVCSSIRMAILRHFLVNLSILSQQITSPV